MKGLKCPLCVFHNSKYEEDERWPKCSSPVRRVSVFDGASFVLMSPNFPAAYDYNTRCGWSLRPVSKNVAIHLSCDNFQLQGVNAAGKCPDYLEVKDTRYCSSQGPQNVTIANVKMMRVIFKSNRRDNYAGFRCTVSAVNHNTGGCVCGIRNTGAKSQDDEVPWMAALVVANTRNVFCGASIVYEDWLLTSARCAKRIKYNKYNYEVLVGARNLTVVSKTEVRHQIKKVRIHQKFDPDLLNSESDIGLIQLKDPVNFSQREVRPVCIPDQDMGLAEDYGIFTGWGTRSGSPDAMKKVEYTILARSECEKLHREAGEKMSGSWICASGVKSDLDPICKVDLGGPLVIRSDDGRFEQIGIASDGSGCNEGNATNIPSRYLNVSKFRRWITNTVEQSDTCA